MRRLGLVGLVCLIAMAGLTVIGSPAQAFTVICTGATKAQVKKCDTSGYAAVMHQMHWRMYGGHNCTNYAAYRMQRAGVPEPQTSLGNARDWAANARKLGYQVNQRPAVGAIAQWKTASSHVAYVEEVGAGYLVLSEDSYTSKTYRRYKVLTGASWYPERFIHFLTPAATPAPAPAPAPAPPAVVKKASSTITVTGPAKVSRRVKPKVRVKVATSDGVAPEGRVRVRRGGATVATVALTSASNGTVTVRIPRMKRGKQWISAVYDGAGTVKASTSSTIKMTVVKPPKVVSSKTSVALPATTIAVGARPIAAITVRAKDNRATSNKVSIFVDGQRVAVRKLTKRKKGRVSVRMSSLAPGKHAIRANYWGSKSVRRSQAKATPFVVVEPTSVTSSLSASSIGSTGSAAVTTTVSTPRGVVPTSGTVEVLVDGTSVAAVPLTKAARGTLTIPLSGLVPGVRRVSVRFAGTAFRLPSTGPHHVLTVLEPSVAAITKGPTSAKVTKETKFDVSVVSRGGVAATSGRVSILDGGTVIAQRSIPASANGTVRLFLPRLSAGTHRLTAAFAGNDLLEPSVSVVRTLKVTQ